MITQLMVARLAKQQFRDDNYKMGSRDCKTLVEFSYLGLLDQRGDQLPPFNMGWLGNQ